MTISFLNKIIKKIVSEKGRIRISVYIALVAVLSGLTYLAYDQYRNTIVAQQEENMLGISRSISRSLELFINDIVDSMKTVSLDSEFTKDITGIEQDKNASISSERLKSFYEAERNSINSIYIFDEKGRILTQYPQGQTSTYVGLASDVDIAINRKKTYIGRVYWDDNKEGFILGIYEPIFDGGTFKGVVTVAVSLDGIYNRLIAPVKIGEKGYAMVKDQHGTILMHPVKEQVGMNVIETRKQVFPNLDYQELEDLIEDQLTGNEGSAVYHSYWWGDNVLKKVRKLNAYTPVHLGEYFWVVAMTMSYDEIQGPINRFSTEIIGIAIIIAAIILMFILALIKMRKNKEELEKETEYLRILNESSEKLRKKEAELYHSHKLKMVGTLAGGIAHDINNLLTPILGYSELLLMRLPKDSEYYEEVDEILKASQKGKDLIEQILSFSRNDNDIVKIEPVSIDEVTKQAIKLLKAIIPKKVVIKEDIKAKCGSVYANFTQIHQVIFNLCTNAYQSLKNGKGVIEISLRNVNGADIKQVNTLLESEESYVELTVKDTGCGMDDETKTRIFDPFFTTKTIGEGTGLGLFVVQNIIDKYKGVITVESEIGMGSCFRVYLPLSNEKFSVENNINSKDILSENKTILIVDDNEEIIKVLKRGLEYLGYNVETETDSLRALNMIKQDNKKYNLVITDYIMPNLKGAALAAAVKETAENTGVILITGYMDENNGIINDNAFIDACISKPVELAKLSEIIQKVLNKYKT